MVAVFHGHKTTLRECRSRFQLSLRGMTLQRLHGCAEEIGLQSRALKLEMNELPQLRTPAILHWDLDHFVVLKSVRRASLTIVDPATGVRRLALREASNRFTGVALELAPTPAFTRKEAPPRMTLWRFLPALRGLGAHLCVVFTMTLVLQAFALVMPLNAQFTVDQGIRQGDMNIVAGLALGFGMVGAIAALTTYFRSLLLLFVGNTSAFRVIGGLAHHMMRLPDAWFATRHTGDVLSRFGSTKPIRNFLMTGAFAMFVDALMALGAFAILLTYAWDLTLVICAFLACGAALNWGTYVPLRNLTHESIQAGALENSSFIENVERHRAIKLLGAESVREEAWSERYVDAINANTRLGRFRIHVGLASGLLGSCSGVVMLLLGAHKVIGGEFTLGMLFAYTSYGTIFSGRVNALIGATVGMRMLRLHEERVADIGLEARELPAARGLLHDLRGRIDLCAVSFTYSDEEGSVLDNLNMHVAAGEFLAVRGASGAGKSTLVKLLCKLIEASSGEVLVDGVDLARIDTTHYRRQFGVVMQEDDLFSGTLVENIAVVDGDPDMARVEWAAKIACIDDDIKRMPMQYMTLVGHMGSTLSGGQRQRVMIARAVYRRPKVLLLDEGTAHLNDELQQQVLTNLIDLGITIIAVTHDVRVVERAQRVVEL